MQPKRHWLMRSALALALVCLAGNVPGQEPPVSVAIVSFQDDTGSGLPSELRRKLAQDLQQTLALGYKDVLPRIISVDVDPAASGALTIDQLKALGVQNGAKFVVRGGVLAVVAEPMIEKHGVTAQLYVEVISAETGSVAATLRAEGKATQADPPAQISDVDVRSEQFRNSALGLALSAAVSQLADPLHQALTTPVVVAAQETGEVIIPPDEGSNATQVDAELQQLIAQAEALLADGTTASTQAVGAVSQSLEALKTALSAKAGQMEAGQDTAAADQAVAAAQGALQAAVAQVTAELSASQVSPEAAVEQPSPEKKNFLANVDAAASQALSILEKIQQIRAMLAEADQSAADEVAQQTEAPDSVMPPEEPVGEVSGAVVDENGNPVGGVEITEPVSGVTTTTDSSGVFRLSPVLNDRIVQVVATKGAMHATAQTAVSSGRLTTLDLQLQPSASSTRPASRILPSTVLLSPPGQGANKGIVTGVVQDAQGRPISRALVTLKGLGVARTDSQGHYRFLNVPAGAHQLIIAPSGVQSRTAQVNVVARQSSSANVQFKATDRIAISPAKTSLILPTAGTLLKGRIVDGDNRPVTGARVSVVQGATALTITTTSKGTFELRNLNPGPYRVVVSKAGYAGAGQNLTLRTRATESRDFRLEKQKSPLVTNVLRNDAARRVVIKGRVRGSDGRGVPNAIVELKPSDRSLASSSVRTNAQGEYSFNARPGHYEIGVRQNAFKPVARALDVKTSGPTHIDFSLQPAPAPAASQRITVQPPTTAVRPPTTRSVAVVPPQTVRPGGVVVQVIDAKTRRPLSGATISISGQRGASSDSSGRVVLTNLKPGTYQVSAVKSGYSSDQRSFVVRSGDTASVTLTLTPPLVAPVKPTTRRN